MKNSTDNEMNILDYIKDDHDRMRALLEKLMNNADSNPAKRTEIIAKVRAELVPHSRSEEAVLYNSMRMSDAPTNKVYHGFREHVELDVLLSTVEAMDAVHADWEVVAKKLQERLNHHMNEEERDLFPQARAAFNAQELVTMSEEFRRLKPEYRDQSGLENSVDLIENLLPAEVRELVYRFAKKSEPAIASTKNA